MKSLSKIEYNPAFPYAVADNDTGHIFALFENRDDAEEYVNDSEFFSVHDIVVGVPRDGETWLITAGYGTYSRSAPFLANVQSGKLVFPSQINPGTMDSLNARSFAVSDLWDGHCVDPEEG